MKSDLKFIVFFLILAISGCISSLQQVEVSLSNAQKALQLALLQEGKPYVYGAQDPSIGFDCSGLVIWSYKQVYPTGLLFNHNKIDSDADVESLYKENCRIIRIEETFPGDIVFIANSDNEVNHCGLLIKVENESLLIIHASGTFKKVIIEKWKIGEEIRGSHIQAIGRLKMLLRNPEIGCQFSPIIYK
jgi:cell wall-associated NlpC family hydrolase